MEQNQEKKPKKLSNQETKKEMEKIRKKNEKDSAIEKLKKELPTVKEGKVWHKLKWMGFKRKDKRKLKKYPENSFLVKMMFSNGTTKEFVICTQEETFTYMKNTYYLRYENGWYNLTQNQYELLYFDDYPVPINREIKKIGDERFWTVTSGNLKPLLKMEYIKALASSQELNKYLSMATTLGVLTVGLLMMAIYLLFKIKSITTALI